MKADSTQRELLKILQQQVMPMARAGGLAPVVTSMPLRVPKTVKLTARETPPLPLPASHRFSRSNTKWPAAGLHSSRYPVMGCICEGEADFCIGVTEQMLANTPGLDTAHGEYVLALPRGSVFIIPPEVPYSDGSRLHWERPHPEKAKSGILWIQIMPFGAVLHACHTIGPKHTHTAAALVRDTRLGIFAQFLIENSSGTNSHELAEACLLSLLLCLDESLSSRPAPDAGEHTLAFLAVSESREPQVEMPGETDSAMVERASRYIRLHLSDNLSLARIAQGSYISVPRLKRLFRSQLDTSVMKFVTQCRLEEARMLLEGTSLATHEIGRICGYPHRTHFSRVFSAGVGLSPEAFRRQARLAATAVTQKPARSPRKK